MLFRSEIEALALLGANSTIIAWSETLTGLQQKTVDGVITSNAGFYTGNIGSIQDHFTDNNMFIESGAFVMCKSYWDSLPAEDQEMLTECMKETMEWSQQSAAELDATDLTKTVEEGQLELVKEDEFDRAACEELFAPLYEKYEAQYGEIWDKVEALK